MGDRCTVQFKNGSDESVILYSHWGGKEFAQTAYRYAEELVAERKGSAYPLDRMEVDVVMIDFIIEAVPRDPRVVAGHRISSDYKEDYDAGHYVIEFVKQVSEGWKVKCDRDPFKEDEE